MPAARDENVEQFARYAGAAVRTLRAGLGPTQYDYGFDENPTLTPADDWQSVIEGYRGNGVITLTDGDYVATRKLTPRGRLLQITGANLGGARVTASWSLGVGVRAVWSGWDWIVPADASLSLRGTQAALAVTDMLIDGASPSLRGVQIIQLIGGDLSMTASQRDCEVRIGPGITQGFGIDRSSLKIAGNTTTKRIKFLDEGSVNQRNVIALNQGSSIEADGLHIINTAGTKNGIGILARRAANIIIQGTGNNRFQGLYRAALLRQAANGHFSGVTFESNARCIMTMEGAATPTYSPSSVVFTNNDQIFATTNSTDGVPFA